MRSNCDDRRGIRTNTRRARGARARVSRGEAAPPPPGSGGFPPRGRFVRRQGSAPDRSRVGGVRHPAQSRRGAAQHPRSEEHTSELQSRGHLVCRLLLEKKKKKKSIRESVT